MEIDGGFTMEQAGYISDPSMHLNQFSCILAEIVHENHTFTHTEMIQIISYSLIHGFALYSLIIFVASFFLSEIKQQKINRFDLSACQIGAIGGFIYLATASVSTLELGRYAPVIWIHLLLILSVQLVWSEKVRTLKWIRLLIACVLLFSLEGWIIALFSGHPNDMLSPSEIPFITMALFWLTHLGIFAVVSGLFHWIKSYFSPNR